jgi:cytochrome c oxidase subunit 2
VSEHLRGTKPQIIAPKGMGPNFWPVMIALTVVNLVIAYIILYTSLDWILPAEWNSAADRAHDIDDLFKFMGVFGLAILVYVVGFVLYAAVAFRRRADEPPDSIGVHIHDNPKLEFWWTVIPTVLLIVLMVLTIQVWHKIQFGAGAPALTTEIIAHQFNFEIRYPDWNGSVFTPPGDMHLPVGEPVRVLVTSADVIHQYWVPEFRLKAAAVPGLVQNLNFTPTRTGTFDIVCSEYCGLNHSKMQGKVIVESPAAFEKWFAGVKAHSKTGPVALTTGDAAAGKALFGKKCAVCHAVGPFDQKIVGPGLRGITADPKHPALVDGKPPTPANIAGILQNGYTGPIGAMPNRQANGLSDKDIANLVAYLVSLK